MPDGYSNVIIVADIDLSRYSGDTGRVMAFAANLIENNVNVKLVVPESTIKDKMMIELPPGTVAFVPRDKTDGSMGGFLKRIHALISKVRELEDDKTILVVEMSFLGGYFALAGFRNFIVDIHGFLFDEMKHMELPRYIPNNLYSKFVYLLEKLAVTRSRSAIVVSGSMRDYIIDKWKIPKGKITVIPNGYFKEQVSIVEKKELKKVKGMVTFIGRLEIWAEIDKIIRVANILKDKDLKFYIIGGGTPSYVKDLERLVETNNLKNVIFTGSVPLAKAYEMIIQSDILLLPFPNALCTEVACPIKLLEYMAFGKAMVVDHVSDVSLLLGEENAALVCNPDDEEEFAKNVLLLYQDEALNTQIGLNAKTLAEDFSWDGQGKKLLDLINHIQRSGA